MALAKNHMNLSFESAATPVTHLFLEVQTAGSSLVSRNTTSLDPKELFQTRPPQGDETPKMDIYIYMSHQRLSSRHALHFFRGASQLLRRGSTTVQPG